MGIELALEDKYLTTLSARTQMIISTAIAEPQFENRPSRHEGAAWEGCPKALNSISAKASIANTAAKLIKTQAAEL